MQEAYDKLRYFGMFKALIKGGMIVWVSTTIVKKKDIEALLKVQHMFGRGVVIHTGGQ